MFLTKQAAIITVTITTIIVADAIAELGCSG